MGQKKDFQKTINALNKHSKKIFGYTKEDETFYHTVKSLWAKIQSPPKHPDGYAFENGILLILEHFEIDCTQIKENMGSEQQYLNGTTEKELEKQIQSLGVGMVVEELSRSGKYYVESFTHAFNKHAIKIDEYIKNVKSLIKEEIKETIVGFLIEDASKLGFVANYKENGEIVSRQIDIIQSKEFLDLFEASPKLDFVLFTTTSYENDGYQRFLSKRAIKVARKEEINVADDIPEFQHFTTTYAWNVYIKKI